MNIEPKTASQCKSSAVRKLLHEARVQRGLMRENWRCFLVNSLPPAWYVLGSIQRDLLRIRRQRLDGLHGETT